MLYIAFVNLKEVDVLSLTIVNPMLHDWLPYLLVIVVEGALMI